MIVEPEPPKDRALFSTQSIGFCLAPRFCGASGVETLEPLLES